MLNKAERYRFLQFFKIYSIIGLLPIEVDLVKWQLKQASKTKKFICAVSYSFFILHSLYKMGSLAYTYFFMRNVQLHHLVIHANVAMSSTMCVYWYWKLYIHSPAMFSAYGTTTVLGNIEGISDERDELKSQWIAMLTEYSMQDLIVKRMPYMFMLGSLVTIAAYIFDPTMRFLLYAALPTGLQNWATFGLCLLEETRFLSIFTSIIAPVLQLQVISFDLVSKQLILMKRTVQKGGQSVRSVHRMLRRLQLYVSIVNHVNSYLIFTWKLFSIAVCILSGYAAIAHFSDYPIFGVMYYVIVFDVMLIYTVMYDKAFNIPDLFGQVTACAIVLLRGNRKGILSRQIRSIPRTGIKVGNFHKMERESTLIFMDFVLKNIVNMLVAYG